MYIRTISRKNKDGSKVSYIQLAHNFWDKEAGHPKAKVLYNFGREDSLDRDGLKRLAQSIRRYLGPGDGAPGEEAVHAEPLRFISSRPFGGVDFLDKLWNRLGIAGCIRKLLKTRNYSMPVERAIFAMVANRALAPSSKLGVEQWVDQDVYIEGLAEIEVQNLYRAMDFLLTADTDIQHDAFFSVADLFNLEVDLLYFDTTSTCFEIEEEDDFRKKGLSKDHRPDLPQAVIGLAVTRDGIPVRCWVWPGNTADMSVVEEVKKDLVGWKLGRVISVVDRGFVSEENLKTLQKTGGHYIAGEKMRSGKADTIKALSVKGRYHVVKDNLEVKEIVVGDGEGRKRYILVRNPQQAVRDREKREATIQKLQEDLAKLGDLKGKAHTKNVCHLVSHPSYGRYLKTLSDGSLRLDQAKIKAEAKLDGKYLIRTSDDTLSPEDIALGYKQLLEVEAAFRTIKSTLELRPVYHRLEERIRAHILLCWLALLLIRVAERETGETWLKMRHELQKLHLGEFKGKHGQVLQTTEITNEQKSYFSALKLEQPPRFIAIKTQ
jgi:transposase